jgi:NAD(P)H-nitrite reductase large subunit
MLIGFITDVGGSQYIIDGRLKLKSDSLIKEISSGGIRFEDGSELPADVIIFATG